MDGIGIDIAGEWFLEMMGMGMGMGMDDMMMMKLEIE